MSEKKPYIISICLDDKCVKKKLKAPQSATFNLVGVIAVGIQVDGELRLVMPLASIDFEDFKSIASKYEVPIDSIAGYVTEIKEEKKGERVIKFESEQ